MIPASTVPDSGPSRPLRTSEVATALGVSARTVRNLIMAGDLPAFTIGAGMNCRHYRVTPHALAAYRRQRQTGRKVVR